MPHKTPLLYLHERYRAKVKEGRHMFSNLLLSFTLATGSLLAQAAELCSISESLDKSIAARNFQILLPDNSTATVIVGGQLPEPSRETVVSFFTEHTEKLDELTTRIHLFMGANQGAIERAEGDLAFLQEKLASHPPLSFVALDISSEELGLLQKAAAILNLSAWAQVHSLGIKNVDWDRLYLLAVGPLFYLKTRQAELFRSVVLMGFDDPALAEFRKSLNWQAPKVPEWTTSVIGMDSIHVSDDVSVGSLGRLPEGDGVFLLSHGSLPVLSPTFMTICQKLQATPTAPQPKADDQQVDNMPTAHEEAPGDEVPTSRYHRWHRHGRGGHDVVSGVNPDRARTLAVSRKAHAYSWVTVDGNGRRWVHIRPLH
jgi:hypothetical protein